MMLISLGSDIIQPIHKHIPKLINSPWQHTSVSLIATSSQTVKWDVQENYLLKDSEELGPSKFSWGTLGRIGTTLLLKQKFKHCTQAGNPSLTTVHVSTKVTGLTNRMILPAPYSFALPSNSCLYVESQHSHITNPEQATSWRTDLRQAGNICNKCNKYRQYVQ